MSSRRGLPLSRSYWEHKADQVLNRVFDAETAIEVEVLERPSAPATDPPAAGPTPAQRPRVAGWPPHWLGTQPGVVLAGIGITGLIATGACLLLIGLWNQNQMALRQERNLLLLERLRTLGPATAPPPPTSASAGRTETTAPTATARAAAAAGDGLPPPPPHEPWMQELASLPSTGAPAAEPLRVPVTDRIVSQPPPVNAPSGGSGGPDRSAKPAAPQLLGVVQVPGRAGAAIFQVAGSSTSAGAGEAIGSSGWRLVSASGDSAVVERGGEQLRLSISSGL